MLASNGEESFTSQLQHGKLRLAGGQVQDCWVEHVAFCQGILGLSLLPTHGFSVLNHLESPRPLKNGVITQKKGVMTPFLKGHGESRQQLTTFSRARWGMALTGQAVYIVRAGSSAAAEAPREL